MSSERKAEAKESRFVSQRKECRGYSEHKEKPDEDSDLPKLDCVLYIEPMLCLKSWQEGESKMSLSRSEQLNEKQGLWSSSILLPPQLSISKSACTTPPFLRAHCPPQSHTDTPPQGRKKEREEKRERGRGTD